ncbi:MAG: EamA family transporter [Candidatus Aenigmatarchaeota archaeon]
MEWFWLSLLAAFLWSIVNIIDKHVIDRELKDPILCSISYTSAVFFVFLFSSLLLSKVDFGIESPISFAAGVIFGFAVYFYFKALRYGEISRVIPLSMLGVLFVVMFALIFFGESLNLLNYIGIASLLLGAILISYKKDRAGKKFVLFGLISAMLFALRDILTKWGMAASPLSVLFWIALGTLFYSLFMIAIHHPHLRKKMVSGVEHIFIVSFISAIALLVFVFAMSIGPLSLVRVAATSQGLFVFILALFLSKTHPHIIKEEMRASIIERKLIAILLIILGIALIA